MKPRRPAGRLSRRGRCGPHITPCVSQALSSSSNAEGAEERGETFRLSPSYGLTTGHEANEWFIDMLREYEEFEVETDEPGEPPLSFWSETVLGVMVG